MSHWMVLPIVLPATMGAALAMFARHDLTLARALSGVTLAAQLVLAVALWVAADTGAPGADGIGVYRMGGWPAPFGIVLVLDRLSALMLVLTALVAALGAWHAAATGTDARGRHFHALVQFQVMGLSGAFLTGDAFNLFVFFEVLLIASYGLMAHGGGSARLKAALQYVVANLMGSLLFLVALGTIYAATGTLNMADIAARAARVEDAALVRIGLGLLFVVFAFKAALLPLHAWLPATYAAAPAASAAIFAIMTKVGLYAILRLGSLGLGTSGPTDGLLAPLGVAGAATVLFGFLAIVGGLARDPVGGGAGLPRAGAYALMASAGTAALALAAPGGAAAGIAYLAQSTLAGAAMMMAAGLVRDARRAPPGAWAANGLSGALLVAGAVAALGLPPSPGFLAKLDILRALQGWGGWGWAWAVVLGGTALGVIGFARLGATAVWGDTSAEAVVAQAPAPTPAPASVPAPAPASISAPVPAPVHDPVPDAALARASALARARAPAPVTAPAPTQVAAPAQSSPPPADASLAAGHSPGPAPSMAVPALAALVLLGAATLAWGPVSAAAARTASQLAQPSDLIEAVLVREGTEAVR